MFHLIWQTWGLTVVLNEFNVHLQPRSCNLTLWEYLTWRWCELASKIARHYCLGFKSLAYAYKPQRTAILKANIIHIVVQIQADLYTIILLYYYTVVLLHCSSIRHEKMIQSPKISKNLKKKKKTKYKKVFLQGLPSLDFWQKLLKLFKPPYSSW